MAIRLADLFGPCGDSRQQCIGAQGRGQVSLTVSVTWTTNKHADLLGRAVRPCKPSERNQQCDDTKVLIDAQHYLIAH